MKEKIIVDDFLKPLREVVSEIEKEFEKADEENRAVLQRKEGKLYGTRSHGARF